MMLVNRICVKKSNSFFKADYLTLPRFYRHKERDKIKSRYFLREKPERMLPAHESVPLKVSGCEDG